MKSAGNVETVAVDKSTRSDSVREFRRRGIEKSDNEMFTSAIQEFNRALELDTADVTSLFYRGLAKFKTADLTGALDDLDRAIAMDSTKPAFYARRGLVKDALKLFDEAKADLDQAIEMSPADAEFHFFRGNIEWHMNDRDAACRDWEFSDKAGYKEAQEPLETHCR